MKPPLHPDLGSFWEISIAERAIIAVLARPIELSVRWTFSGRGSSILMMQVNRPAARSRQSAQPSLNDGGGLARRDVVKKLFDVLTRDGGNLESTAHFGA
jgi:hypothetical protein